jgi:hypothetical protein
VQQSLDLGGAGTHPSALQHLRSGLAGNGQKGDVVLLPTLVLCVLIGGVATFLVVRLFTAVRLWREPTTRWVRRSGTDRRRRHISVPVDRRQGPRRQEELAARFLADMGGQRRRSVGRLNNVAGSDG